MYEFLNDCDILKLNQDGINNLNKSITNKRTEAVKKSLSAKIAQDLMNSLQNATRASRRASAILIKLTHKREEEKNASRLFLQSQYYLDTTVRQEITTTTKRKLQAGLPVVHRCKSFQ